MRTALITVRERARRVCAGPRLAAFCAALVLFALAAPAGANDFGSRGDVQADLEAFGNGGWAILNHSPSGSGAPADVDIRFEIRPLGFYRGSRYCVDDWHVILIAWFEGGDASFSRADAEALLNPVTLRFILDGTPLVTARGPIKPFLNPEPYGWINAYYFQEGRVVSPAELSVGDHELRFDAYNAGRLDYRTKVRFIVDPVGTGACL
jgi:hypothetical protein